MTPTERIAETCEPRCHAYGIGCACSQKGPPAGAPDLAEKAIFAALYHHDYQDGASGTVRDCIALASQIAGLVRVAWAEGHETDEHGAGLCECVNPYGEAP